MNTKLLIDGKLIAGEGAAEQVLNPATGKPIGNVAEASSAQVDAAVKAAHAAFETWSRTTPVERASLLLKLAERIEQDAASFAELESLNCGKPRARALADEMPAIVTSRGPRAA
jgi:aminobutyraldehyde dehydrogenase